MKQPITVAAIILSDVWFVQRFGYYERHYGDRNCVTGWKVNANVSKENNTFIHMVSYTLQGVDYKIDISDVRASHH
jgi:hypothetical protein